ncbi:uncharacterized protein LOC131435810 [Malaya genurostris]|uniref:uncharacterized protein LOC131435810 n=1 Tax=Malaya genurostris TaxID=325434 RepID=UPI0026F383B2|nr:uncharacterized protein LOC131435810 [Malaya genurostris]XP_058460006.1 uncharacterized protein LOC131435810 [Malaya genurostris]
MELRITAVIGFVTILATVGCVPMKYEIGYRNSIDLDAEQTEARYDQGMLSDIMNDDRAEMQKAESCVADNFKYDHGQKIQRNDPCEICLCIDGEIFCWWKQCDSQDSHELPLSIQFATQTAETRQWPQLSNTPTSDSVLPPSSSSSAAAAAALTPPPTMTTRTTSVIPRITNDVTSSASSSSSSSSSFHFPPTAAAVPAGSDQLNSNMRILHPGPPEDIPQNILSFPQTPPIMMYRPAIGKNATNSDVALTNRNKHKGPPKKVKPLRLNDGLGLDAGSNKKPYRKSIGKGYVVNYEHTERVLTEPERRVTERVVNSDNLLILNDGDRSSEENPSGGRFMVHTDGVRRNGPSGKVDDNNDDDDEDIDDDDDEDDDEDDSDESEENHDSSGAFRNRPGTSGGTFGGYGYGMIKEPDEDKQQHYIITSSGHVEMFDDTNMEATENVFRLNRLSQQQPLTVESTSSSTGQPFVTASSGTLDELNKPQATILSIRENKGQSRPIPPMISLTTNVTKHSNDSDSIISSLIRGDGPPLPPPLTAYAPQYSGSVIDVINSTVDGDYLDDNQTEFIYPAVPGLGGRTGGSRVDGGGKLKIASTIPPTDSGIGVGERSVTEQHCVVMGVSYKVGAVLKQETGNCLHCVCVAGPENDPVPRVTCTPLNCPPLILPDILDGAGF